MQLTFVKCFQYDSESKQKTFQWKKPTFPRAKEVGMSKSQIKTMLVTFFDIKDVILFEFIPQDQRVNYAY
jgi:hypothetical protein